MKDDYQRARDFECPEYIPIDIGVLPAAWMNYRDELDALARRHPLIFRNYNGKK